MGQNRIATDHLVEAQTRYDEQAHASLAVAYGQDVGVLTLCYVEYALLNLGYPDKSLQAGGEAIALARRLNHPLSFCLALAFHATSMFSRNDPTAVLPFAEECIAVAGEKGIPPWLAMATAYRGWAIAQLGAVDDGIQQIREGTAAWRATGADVALAVYLGLLAESQLAGGQAMAALKTTDEALTWIDKNSERMWESVVRCCRGDIFRELEAPDNACAEYETALSVARLQEAKWWELRAAVGLAKLWRDQGKRTEARDLLAPIYDWFTEGFDSPDLNEAKVLLDSLV
jgi:tetratricopeptide (TPR) repeat protein